MFAMIIRHDNRLAVTLAHNRKIRGRIFREPLGSLGTLALSDPLLPSERIRFWAAIDQRWDAIIARYPNRITSDHVDRINATIDRRIPGPSNNAERRLFSQAVALLDAFDRLDAGDAWLD
jgi:hypothetical protein